MIINQLQFDVIQALLDSGITILEIYDPLNREATLRYFAVNEVTVPQSNIPYYTVSGKDMTYVIQQDSLNIQQMDSRNRITVILTKINEVPDQQRRYSSSYQFVWYLK